MKHAVLRTGLALGCFAVSLTILAALMPSRAFAADVTTTIATPAGCAAAGGTYVPPDAIIPVPGCNIPMGRNPAPAPAPVQASNLCDALRQTYQGYLSAAAQDAGVQSAVDLDYQGANAILGAYNRGNCANGGAPAAGGTALRDQVRQQLANRSLGAQMNAVNPNGFGQTYVPITAPRGTTANKLQYTNNNLAAMNSAFGALADQEAQDEANRQAQQQQEAEEQAERDAQAAQQRAIDAAADAQRRAALDNPFDGSQQASAPGNPFIGASGNQLPYNPYQVATNTPSNGNPFAGPDQNTDPAEANRKLGEPSQADSLPFLTRSGCEADHGGIIALPGNAKPYCVIEVDNPEPTNEWHYMIEDAAPAKKPQIKSPGVAVMGVRD
jgi:hypothetical protein